MSEVTAGEAAQFTRAQAIEALKLSPSDSDRRMAAIMAAGPEITPADEQRLRTLRLRRSPIYMGVLQMCQEIGWERIQVRAEMAELAGGRL